MLKHPALLIAAGSALAAASAVSVFALAFAAFALLRPFFGEAGTYALVALVTAIVAGIGAFFLTREAKGDDKDDNKQALQNPLASGLTEIIRSRPGAALGISLVLGLLASKNPRFALEMVSFAQRLTQPPQR